MKEASLVSVDVVKAILTEATEGGRERLLAAAIATDTEKFPNWLLAHLPETVGTISETPQISGLKDAGVHVSQVDQLSNSRPALPQYRLPVSHEWIANDADIAGTRAALNAELCLLPPGEQLLVGMDTEWGESLTWFMRTICHTDCHWETSMGYQHLAAKTNIERLPRLAMHKQTDHPAWFCIRSRC